MEILLYRCNMKNKVVLVFITALFYVGSVSAQPYRSALGAAAEFTFKDYFATGATYKFFMSEKSAGEVNALASRGGYYISLLYQYHFPLSKQKQLFAYAGAGAFNIIYPRGSVGFEYRPKQFPLSFAFDWRPLYEWKVDDDVDNSGLSHFGLNVRYILKN